ncbi:hypothetical protein FACS1894219_09660 [Clostridia bacterium]|nr:hypothetical protein FACS1894219_09660 [Clostridia bacterium]
MQKTAEQSGHHFNTMKKHVDKDDWNTECKPIKARVTKLDPLKEAIDGWLCEDLKRKRKFKRNVTNLFIYLCTDEVLN